ncbi:Anaerobic dimethyl sulfoxide reductase chain B [Anatilimnocola aggregata]|uniref:Anaerobic dimethyl sulfoxide reductase chain B n=2 Tax=Anatilimnocola aggregata TaxID=2528021 RepID=A0A517Y681_9BACT|nr:Anaerobic dimethyl sulfoxide reductase chain B [Anatilimnocola aggregata]
MLNTAPTHAPQLSLIEQLLAEQQSLPAAARFAQWHDDQQSCSTSTAHVAYRSLIPLTAPAPGEQYAFEVDLDACSGCKACVTACHSLNGLDEHETWRDVGLLVSTDERPALQYITSACHHCVEPACLAGCPVKAYDKDPVTGIVRHLDDQCIGCQYCVLMCPYDVPKYSHSKGIVRKCDMCRQRLAVDEAPACVAACPNQAIRIATVKMADATAAAAKQDFLAAAPDPRQTIPTTRFISTKMNLATWQAADAAFVKPAHAHWPLVVMLVLTQVSVGILLAERVLTLVSGASYSLPLLLTSLLIGGLGAQAAVFHLGRPLGAWRAWLGLRTSWLSREILVFGLYSGVLSAAVGLAIAVDWKFVAASELLAQIISIVAWLALAAGIAGVCSSAMIYAVTQRPSWRLWRTGGKFLLTSLIGTSVALAIVRRELWFVAFAALGAKLLFEAFSAWHSIDRYGRVSGSYSPLQGSATLLRGPLERLQSLRFLLGSLAVVTMFAAAATSHGSAAAIQIGAVAPVILLTIAGELLERTLFFMAVVPAKMPGGVTT